MDGREDAASSSRKVQNNLFRGAVTRTGTPASAAEGLASKKKPRAKIGPMDNHCCDDICMRFIF